jgi:hypothetical protein
MGGSFSTVSTHIKQCAFTGFLMYESETSIEIHKRLLAYYGDDAVDISTLHHWVRKSMVSSKNLDKNDQLQSGRPVSATHCSNRQKVDEFLQKNQQIS